MPSTSAQDELMKPADEVGDSSLPVSGAAEAGEIAEGLPLTQIPGAAAKLDFLLSVNLDHGEDEHTADYGDDEPAPEPMPKEVSEKAQVMPDTVKEAASAMGRLANVPPDDLHS